MQEKDIHDMKLLEIVNFINRVLSNKDFQRIRADYSDDRDPGLVKVFGVEYQLISVDIGEIDHNFVRWPQAHMNVIRVNDSQDFTLAAERSYLVEIARYLKMMCKKEEIQVS